MAYGSIDSEVKRPKIKVTVTDRVWMAAGVGLHVNKIAHVSSSVIS